MIVLVDENQRMHACRDAFDNANICTVHARERVSAGRKYKNIFESGFKIKSKKS